MEKENEEEKIEGGEEEDGRLSDTGEDGQKNEDWTIDDMM